MSAEKITNGKGGGEANNLPADAGNDNPREEPFVDDECRCVVCRSDMVGIYPCLEKRDGR